MGNMICPKISIIVPVYKIKEEYLRICIDSCCFQTYTNLEVILVDDGSPDQSGAICDEYAFRDPRIKVVHQINKGVSSARNAGIDVVTGEWLTFLDADDFFEADTFQSIVDKIVEFPDLDLIFFPMVKDYEGRLVYNQPMYSQDRELFDQDSVRQLRLDVLESQLDRNILRMTFCKVVRTQIIENNTIRFNPELPLCEDVVFWFEAIQYVSRAYYINCFFYHYRQLTDSATFCFRPNVETEHTAMLASLKAVIDSTDCPADYVKGYSLEAFYSMQRMITQGFYHKDNPAPFRQRSRACRKALGTMVYQKALSNVVFSELTANHKIKYLLLRMHFYSGLDLLRKLFGVLTNRKTDT